MENSYMEDWDLQAVVRGCSTSEVFASTMNKQPLSMFATSDFDQDNDIFKDLTKSFEPKREDDHHLYKLEGIYSSSPSCPESFLTSAPLSTCLSIREEKKEPPPELQKSLEEQPLSESSGSGVSSVSCSTNEVPHPTKWKRSRKNDQKKVVQQVAAGSQYSDMWAWRKYGQKPIKGSPYPRSYYRCSSLKGCMARKQMERSISDPSIFIVSYTNEHSHGFPPRRNALAGSTRSAKSLAILNKAIAENEPKLPNTTSKEPSETPSRDKFFQPEASGDRKEEETMLPEEIGDQMLFSDNIFSDDDFYPSFGDLEGLLFD